MRNNASVVFDLDKTLWFCADKHGESIWAKQLLPPLMKEGGMIYDDVGSTCSLNERIYNLVKCLFSKEVPLSYLSVGGIYNYPDNLQPSLALLRLFGLLDIFDQRSELAYKTYKKSIFFKRYNDEQFLLVDDNIEVLRDVSTCPNCLGLLVDSPSLESDVLDWCEQ